MQCPFSSFQGRLAQVVGAGVAGDVVGEAVGSHASKKSQFPAPNSSWQHSSLESKKSQPRSYPSGISWPFVHCLTPEFSLMMYHWRPSQEVGIQVGVVVVGNGVTGLKVGAGEGEAVVGAGVLGETVGCVEGWALGSAEGFAVGSGVGCIDGFLLGLAVGRIEGLLDGRRVG